jgi:ABC-type multidrug transport system ATPase subunit
MKNLLAEISNKLINHESVVLIGPSDAGKTYWAKNILIPYLESRGKKVCYLEDGDAPLNESAEIVICDEVETLFDEAYFQSKSTEPYYSKEYLEKVHRWHKKHSALPNGTLFIITRNYVDQVENLFKNFHKADWDGRTISVFVKEDPLRQ